MLCALETAHSTFTSMVELCQVAKSRAEAAASASHAAEIASVRAAADLSSAIELQETFQMNIIDILKRRKTVHAIAKHPALQTTAEQEASIDLTETQVV